MNCRKTLRRVEISIKHLSTFFARYRACDITTDAIRRYMARRFDDGLKPATIRNEVNVLRRAFTLALQVGRVREIPHVPKLQIRNVRTGFFEEPELRRVVEHLSHGLRPIAEFGFWTGWRISELLGLQWRQVDFEAGVVRLEVGSTKNDEGRVLPFVALPPLRDLLIGQRERTDRKERRHKRVIPWVFHRRGRRILRIEAAWKTACEKAGCPDRRDSCR